MTNTYEGWKNQETWAIALCFDNSEPLYRKYIAHAKDAPFTADSVQSFVQDAFPAGVPAFWGAGNSKRYLTVDWQEIAEHFNAKASEC